MNTPNTSRNQYSLETGTLLDGRYEIRRLLGKGGFAKVYLAQHVHLDRLCALKILDLPTQVEARDQFLQRFTQEARIAVKIKHPNVVDIYDFGVSAEHGPYISMEYLDGHDLEVEIERNGAMELERAIRLFVPALEALAQGHRQNIAHKDLKPSNLFLVEPGTPMERMVVLDFGIARLFGEGEIRMTQTGSFSGTPAYLAPEYIEKQLVTPALDVYQMGLIFIEAITASPAVEGDSGMALMIAHCQGEVRVPQELNGTRLGEILRNATRVDPEKRLPDGGAFAKELLSLNSLPKLKNGPAMFRRNRESADVVSPSTLTDLSVHNAHPRSDSTRSLRLPLLGVVVLSLLAVVFLLAREEPTMEVPSQDSRIPDILVPETDIAMDPARDTIVAAVEAAKTVSEIVSTKADVVEAATETVKSTPQRREKKTKVERRNMPASEPKLEPPTESEPKVQPTPQRLIRPTPQPTITD